MIQFFEVVVGVNYYCEFLFTVVSYIIDCIYVAGLFSFEKKKCRWFVYNYAQGRLRSLLREKEQSLWF